MSEPDPRPVGPRAEDPATLSRLEDLYARHVALAGRLLQRGDPVRAAHVCLGILDKFTPRPAAPPLRLLVESILRLLLHPDTEAFTGLLRRALVGDEHLRHRCAAALAAYLAHPRLDGDQRLLAQETQIALASLASEERLGAVRGGPWPALAGIVNVAFVPLGGRETAQCRRLHVRLVEAGEASAQSIGTECPGQGVSAAASYLEAAGVEPLGAWGVETLVEGWFDQIRGESFALPIAVAIVSIQIGAPVPHDVALTGALSLAGEPRGDGSHILVLPVDAIARKCEAALAAGCRSVIIPEHVEPGAAFCEELARRGCRVVPVATLAEALGQLFPKHAAASTPVVASPGEMWHALVRRSRQPSTALQWASALTLGAIVFERGFVGEYLVRPEYTTAAAGIAGNALASGLVGTMAWHLVDLPRRLPATHPLPRWSTATALLGLSFAAAWGIFHTFLPSVRRLPPAPHGQLWEHPSFQTFKDLSAAAFFASLLVLSPAYVLQSAERLDDSGRRRWAYEVVAGRLGRGVAGPVAEPRTLALITAAGIAAMLPMDVRGVLPGNKRYGHDRPWRTIHVQLRDLGLSVAGAVFIAWFAKGVARWLSR
jgi:hypothetical protein